MLLLQSLGFLEEQLPLNLGGAFRDVNVEEFKRGLYQWASSLTSSGRNLPFALPIKTTHTKAGFEVNRHSASQSKQVWPSIMQRWHALIVDDRSC